MRILRSLLVLSILAGAVCLGSPVSAATTGLSPRPVRILCKVIATSNLTLSGAQTVDSVALVAGDVACPVAQSDNKNGAYLVQSGAWKPIDPGLGTGLELYAQRGSSNINKVYGADTGSAITWGTTAVTFTLKTGSGTAFNPAAPGAIGGTTPAAITGTTITATTQFTGPATGLTGIPGAAITGNIPVAAIATALTTPGAIGGTTPSTVGATTVNLLPAAAPSSSATLMKLFGLTGGKIAGLLDLQGDTLQLQQLANTGTSKSSLKMGSFQVLNNGGTIDIPTGGRPGLMAVIAADGAGDLTYGIVAFKGDGATSTNGLTFSNFDTAAGASKLSAALQAGNSVRITDQRGLGANADILVVVFSHDAS